MRLFFSVLALLTAGCMGDNQLSGSVDALFPLQVSHVDVLRNEEAWLVRYLANHGASVDLVVEVSVYIRDQALKNGSRVSLQGEYSAGHPRTTVAHLAAGEPLQIFAPVARGDLLLSSGGNPGEQTRGNFSMSFAQGDGYGAGRTLVGTFAGVAEDAGFGPNGDY